MRKTIESIRLSNGKVATPGGFLEADVVIEGEKIKAIEAPVVASPAIDCTGLLILPGAVDPHTHFGMPIGGGRQSLGWRESSEAALLGGTTTVVDFANPERGETLSAAVARWKGMADPAILCDYGLHCTVIETADQRLAEIPRLVEEGIPTFKGFLAYPGRLMLEKPEMKRLMQAVAQAKALLLVHAEDGAMNTVAEKVLCDVGRTAPRWHPLAHPARSETVAVETALNLARETGCPLEIVHASLSATAQRVAQARHEHPDGPPILCEVCLHHLFADEGMYEAGHEAALGAICSPPLRAPEEGPALLKLLADGTVDFLSTDHCEFDLKTKAAGAAGGFAKVPNGCGGVGERLTLSYALGVVPGSLTPERWIEAIATRPAELMGLGDRKGKLAVGYDADIVLFDPAPEYRWQPLGQSDRAGSIWAGMPVAGRVRDVFLRGRQVVANGRLIPDTPNGCFLERTLR